MSEIANELLELSGRLEAIRKQYVSHPNFGEIERLRSAATDIGQSHSGSWLGYHARVYYATLTTPPAGARFSQEWGFVEAFTNDTRGDWKEFTYDEIKNAALKNSQATLPLPVANTAEQIGTEYEEIREELESIFSTLLGSINDEYVKSQKSELDNIRLLKQDDYVKSIRPSGQIISRDMPALTAGLHIPPHVSIIAYTVQFTSLEYVIKSTSSICKNVARHLQRKERSGVQNKQVGTKIFIGHGISPVWRDLKDFLSERLHLEYDEFNRVPVAGVTTSVRLQEMLDNARFAFIVMTAEDETAEGRIQARMNVIHEAGLFQGRLGLPRAIILLEDGCEEFSNIQGLGQIRFPKGNISAKFEDIRMVLEREGML